MIGKNRSPHQIFPRSTWEPQRSDANLLPKPVIMQPSRERMPFGGAERGGARGGELHPDGPGPWPADFMSTTDLGTLPWTRERGDEWTTPAMRAAVLAWVRSVYRAHEGVRFIGWDVLERATGDRSARRLSPRFHYLRIGFSVRRANGAIARVEVSQSFPLYAREGAALAAQLAALEPGLALQLRAIA